MRRVCSKLNSTRCTGVVVVNPIYRDSPVVIRHFLFRGHVEVCCTCKYCKESCPRSAEEHAEEEVGRPAREQGGKAQQTDQAEGHDEDEEQKAEDRMGHAPTGDPSCQPADVQRLGIGPGSAGGPHRAHPVARREGSGCVRAEDRRFDPGHGDIIEEKTAGFQKFGCGRFGQETYAWCRIYAPEPASPVPCGSAGNNVHPSRMDAIVGISHLRDNFFRKVSSRRVSTARRTPLHILAIRALAVTFLFAPSLHAQSPRQQAEQAAGAYVGSTDATKSTDNQLRQSVPGFTTANPEALSGHYEDDGARLEGATLQGLANDTDGQGGEAASTIIDTYVTRPDFGVTRTDEFLSTARGALGNPDLLAGDLFSTNQNPACRPTDVTPAPLEIRSCDVFRAPGESKCSIGTEVDVLAEKSYACFSETATYRKRCDETLSVSCKQVLSNCRLEDGLLTTPNSDLVLSYTNFRHRARLPNIDAGGGCISLTRRMVINISDINKLAVARFSRIDFHDGLSVYVNGTFVWGGPYGGGTVPNLLGDWRTGNFQFDSTEPAVARGLGSPLPWDGSGFPTREFLGHCIQNSNVVTTVGKDIRPLMRTGANVVEFVLTAGGSAAGFTADFEILMSCCGEWEETWSRQCPY